MYLFYSLIISDLNRDTKVMYQRDKTGTKTPLEYRILGKNNVKPKYQPCILKCLKTIVFQHFVLLSLDMVDCICCYFWILQTSMALAALFAIIMAANMAYKMMVKNEPLDVMKLFRPLIISVILCWWYPPADTGIVNSGSSWSFLDFLSYIPNSIGSYTHDLYAAEATQIEDKFKEVQELIYVRDTMYTDLQAQADIAHKGTSDPNLIESTMEQTGVDEVTNMEKDAAKLYFTSLTSGFIVGLDKIIMLISLTSLQNSLVGHVLLSANSARNAHDIRSDTMGILTASKVGGRMGKMGYEIPDCSLLRSLSLFRWVLRTSALRHSPEYTGRKPNGDNSQ